MQSLLTRLLLGGGGGFSPASLFSGGAEGAWYDPSDLSTLFQDTAGTTPAVMPGGGSAVPVGMMLDKSKGLVLGPELRGTGTIATVGSPGTLATFNPTTGAGSAFRLDGSNTSGVQIAVTDGRYYLLDVEQLTGSLQIRGTGPAGNQLVTNIIGRQTYRLFVSTGEDLFFVTGVNASSVTFTVHSVRELPGNHAISYNTTTARPELSARVNLLTYSEQFDNGAWTKADVTISGNATVAPNGTTTADKLIETATTNSRSVYQLLSVAGLHLWTVCVKSAGQNRWLRFQTGSSGDSWFNPDTGLWGTVGAGRTASVESLGNGWYRLFISWSASGSTFMAIGLAPGDGVTSYSGDGVSGLFLWGADLRPANIGANVPAYQRIEDANTYDTNGFPLYLRFDGSDDAMYTPANLDLTSTDKATVFAGVRKLSDAAIGVVTELSSSAGAVLSTGTFVLHTQTSPVGYRYAAGSGASGAAFATDDVSTFTSPISNVITGISNFASATINDEIGVRVNGVVPTQAIAGTVSTGNFGTYPLYIGSRAGTSLRFNGYLYGLTVVGSQLTTPQIESMESWTAGKTGISIP